MLNAGAFFKTEKGGSPLSTQNKIVIKTNFMGVY